MADSTSPGADEQDIGDLDNETIFVPSADDAVAAEHDEMQMGKGEENDLRDPYFRTDEGQAWLDEHEQREAGA